MVMKNVAGAVDCEKRMGWKNGQRNLCNVHMSHLNDDAL